MRWKAKEFVDGLVDIAKNHKTVYILGCIGAPMTKSLKHHHTTESRYPYNRTPERLEAINAADSDTFGFDCVCLLKAWMWGWKADKTHRHGGAVYASNGVPDIDDAAMFNLCTDKTTDFSKIEVGEAVWMPGHIGVYVGDGLAVECTPIWKDGVQLTACNCDIAGYPRRDWIRHGKLPYIDYTVDTPEWQRILYAKVDRPDDWIAFVNDMKMHHLGKWLPQLIEKISK